MLGTLTTERQRACCCPKMLSITILAHIPGSHQPHYQHIGDACRYIPDTRVRAIPPPRFRRPLPAASPTPPPKSKKKKHARTHCCELCTDFRHAVVAAGCETARACTPKHDTCARVSDVVMVHHRVQKSHQSKHFWRGMALGGGGMEWPRVRVLLCKQYRLVAVLSAAGFYVMLTY